MDTLCIAKGPMFLQAEDQDTDQTERMCKLTDSFESLLMIADMIAVTK